MSTTQPKAYTCDRENCTEQFNAGTGYNGHCSEYCYHAHRGEKVLNLLKYDHRFCHGDFSKLKTINRPTDEQLRQIEGIHSKDSVVGFQYGTENAETGEKTLTAREDRKEIVGTGIVCGNCGTTDYRDSFQRDFSPRDAAKRLRKRIQETRDEGQHQFDFSTEAFVEAWNSNVGDWELALGRALEG
jgi:hypothetical protein